MNELITKMTTPNIILMTDFIELPTTLFSNSLLKFPNIRLTKKYTSIMANIDISEPFKAKSKNIRYISKVHSPGIGIKITMLE
jgi:hypothetical protein